MAEQIKTVSVERLALYHEKAKEVFANKSAATTEADGLLAKEDKAKLDNIQAGAQVNTITGVKGSAETDYRTGNIEITKANVGLGNVDNTADAEKEVKSAATLQTARNISITGGATAAAVAFDGSADVALNVTGVDATKLTGIVPIENLPAGALERCVLVADDTARFALTTDNVQQGDTVKVQSTGLMYFVKDDTKLDTEAGYEVYTAGAASSVPWAGVTGKPEKYTPAEHTHAGTEVNLTGYTKGTAAAVAETDNVNTAIGKLEAALDNKMDGNGTYVADVAIEGVKITVSKGDGSSAEKTLANFIGAAADAAGSAGVVPAPELGDQEKFLKADGTWGTPVNTTYGEATQTAPGLMSSTDKTKLDGIVECTEADIEALFA